MAKATVIQGTFNAGELSPLLQGRVDTPRYKQGLDTCVNYIPTLQGPLARRPGTKYMNAVKDSTKPAVLIPFQFSQTQAYMLEFGDQYIRFYANNGQIVTSGTTYKMAAQAYGLPSPVVPFNIYASRPDQNPKAGESSPVYSTITTGSILEIQSPYAWTDVAKIKWAQNADTLYLTHPSYPTYKLQRFGSQFWDLKQVLFQDGPYVAGYNSYSIYADNVAVALTYNSSVAAGAATTSWTVDTGPTLTVNSTANASGLIKIGTSAAHNYQNGQKVYISGVNGTVEANNNNSFGTSGSTDYWTISVYDATHFILLGSTFTHAWTTGGTVQPALFDYTNKTDRLRNIAVIVAGVRYWGVILDLNNCAEALIYSPTGQNSAGTSVAATAWQMGKYSSFNGYPSCAAFHQGRLVLAGCPLFPQDIDGSEAGGKIESFAPSPATTNAAAIPPATALQVNASNAYNETLASKDVNVMRWLSSNGQGLLGGAMTSEWLITPSSSGEALSPLNFSATQTSFTGSADIDAVTMANAVIYVQRAQRKIRELNYFFQVGTFRSNDMTELSEHITNPSVTKLAAQRETQPLVWAIRSDGVLISMIYSRDDASIQAGWTRHILGGRSDNSGTQPIVYSMAVIPSTDLSFDQLWLVVKRYINGASVYTIEYMTKIFDEVALQEDAFQGDCGATYDNPKTITGITNANPTVVTCTAHGFSAGQRIQITGVVGMGLSTTDINGNVTTTNLVNYGTFLVASPTANTFSLTDFSSNAISSISYGSYVSGGQVRAMITNIAGLTSLANEAVSILADGGVHPDVTVSNAGGITLSYPAAKVQIGYSYKSQMKLLRLDAGSADGSSIGKTRRTSRLALLLQRVAEIAIGTNFNRLIPIKFPRGDVQQADIAPALYSGLKREGLESTYSFESQACVQQSSMLPGTILGVTSFMEEFDV